MELLLFECNLIPGPLKTDTSDCLTVYDPLGPTGILLAARLIKILLALHHPTPLIPHKAPTEGQRAETKVGLKEQTEDCG